MFKNTAILKTISVIGIIFIFLGLPIFIMYRHQQPNSKIVLLKQPKIVSIPPTETVKGDKYIYRLNIENFDTDSHFLEVKKPPWLQWDDTLLILSGVVPKDINEFNVEIYVKSLSNNDILDEQKFTVDVLNSQESSMSSIEKDADTIYNKVHEITNSLEIVSSTSSQKIPNEKSEVLGAVSVDDDVENTQVATPNLDDPFILLTESSQPEVLGVTKSLPNTAVSPITSFLVGVVILVIGMFLHLFVKTDTYIKTNSGLEILIVKGHHD